MILAEKITILRKKNNWSQEELAEQLGISRQSVSKWESGASIPDLDKIIKMSSLFGVSTDYLLKDELEEISFSETDDEPEGSVRSISLEEANEFMAESRHYAKWLAPAVSGCALSPIPMIVMGGMSEYGYGNLTEDQAGGFGVAILLLLIALSVGIMILKSMRVSKFEYLEKELISLQYGVEGIVQKKKAEFFGTFCKCMAIGTMMCIVGVLPMFVAVGLGAGEMCLVLCLAVLLALIAGGVWFFVWSSTIYGCFDKLLQQGDYTVNNKLLNRKLSFLPGIYWSIIVAIYLAVSFSKNNWHMSWIIWPVAGVLYAAVVNIVKVVVKSKGIKAEER